MAKVLIVDDSETLRTQLKRELELEGHTVIEATDGDDGISAFVANSDARLIICDVNMPRVDGLTMCERLKKLSQPIPPIFMLTTESSKEAMNRAKPLGVVAWIVKPYNSKLLMGAVRKMTSES